MNDNNNYQHNYNDNCFGAIQEEKMPSNTCQQTNSTTMNGNCLKVQNELAHQPSSSSSSSSLNNQMRANNGNCKNHNYGSSISNATTGKLSFSI